MNRFLINKIYPYIFLILLITWGCGTLPDIVSTEKEKGEKYSADEIRYLTIDQPSMASGDYFRERNQEPTIDPSKFFSKSKTEKTTVKTEEKAETVSKKAKIKNTQQKPASQAVSFPVKTGFIIDRNNVGADTVDMIYQSAKLAAEGLDIIIAEKEMIDEVLAQTQCSKQKDLKCLSQALGIYPGIRMIILVKKYIIPAQFPGTLTSIIGIADTGLDFNYPFMEIKVPVNVKSDLDAIMPGIMRNILDFASRKSNIMPWFCRAFSHENNEWYITAGRQSGLKPGDSLKVIKGSKFAKSPAGIPAGWISGTEKGILKVQKLFSKDFAVCTLESGTGPDKEDILINAANQL